MRRAERPLLVRAKLLYSASNHQWTEAATQLQLLGGAALDDGEKAGLCDVEGVHEIPRNPDLLYILGFDREIENFFQATLPVRCAGLGLRNSYKHSSAAYVASVLSCLDLMLMLIGPENVDVGRVGVEDAVGGQEDAGDVRGGHDPGDGDRAEDDHDHGSEDEQDSTEVIPGRLITPTVLSSLSEAAGKVITLADLLAGTNQKTLSHKIDQTRLKQLQDSFEDSPRDTDCIAALTTPRSREFLNLVPCRDLHIRSDQF